MTVLDFTGERMVPEAADERTFWEHLYRYKFAARFARDRDVLDIACGEGYGTAALVAAGARGVVGVDIDPDSCEHASRKYGIDARCGDATEIPLGNGSVDLVVSFETVEHVANAPAFLRECARVLRPGGRIVISTPNVDVYNPTRDPRHNPFHCGELSTEEFRRLLSGRFHDLRMYQQRPMAAGRWSPRSLSLQPSPWGSVRGFWRLRGRCRAFQPPAEAAARLDPVAEILRPEGPLARLLNPYAVRPYSDRSRPVYLICVATKW